MLRHFLPAIALSMCVCYKLLKLKKRRIWDHFREKGPNTCYFKISIF